MRQTKHEIIDPIVTKTRTIKMECKEDDDEDEKKKNNKDTKNIHVILCP